MKQRQLALLAFFSFVTLLGQDIDYVHPTDLLNKHRFSVMGKVIFAKRRLLNAKSTWADEVYGAHLYAINQCSGDEYQLNLQEEMVSVPRKNNIDDYKKTFESLITSMRSKGFDAVRSVLFKGANTILEGEHRLACSLCLDLLVPCKKTEKPDWMHSYTSDFFRNRKVPEKYLDNMALEYAQAKNNCYIVSLFSKARDKDAQVRALLDAYGSVIYEKEVVLAKEGPFNIMQMFYISDPWFGTRANSFYGAYGKTAACFNLIKTRFPVRVYLFECESLDTVVACKKEIRSLFNLGHDSVHINDIHKETVQYAQKYFNGNSLHFVNHAKPKKFKKFLMLIDQYKKWIRQNNIDAECLCIDSSAVLSAYGIRDCNDLDILHHGYDKEVKAIPYKDIGSHNDEMRYHAVSKDEIIFNPQYHFYYAGLKFASLDLIKKMKQKRNEAKDRKDVAAIKQYE